MFAVLTYMKGSILEIKLKGKHCIKKSQQYNSDVPVFNGLWYGTMYMHVKGGIVSGDLCIA